MPGWTYRPLSTRTEAEVIARLLSRAWTAARVGHCAHPIRLRGSSTTVDKATGEVLSTYLTTGEALGLLHIRCGNRRCPALGGRAEAAVDFGGVRRSRGWPDNGRGVGGRISRRTAG
ncbi:replication initiator [Lapillicoccus sp.]|uniref:replication initiator n=1 Tax=Lapillicoccus sp. TaxID=1909287 RepID=UPI00387ED7FF